MLLSAALKRARARWNEQDCSMDAAEEERNRGPASLMPFLRRAWVTLWACHSHPMCAYSCVLYRNPPGSVSHILT
ncbi:hypothetical protein TRIATDRAFT_301654 [Trichoderma atroviride IMI 206040]|uniref:Uncharacterized protein n=1 Tax=Hypocrea atroviridis (strain ATCC 20476 / IMI 206040) TaxID=452589 RepID=G9P8D4_HYPAI|nr:uncharacterized protein TRIATDRAFT_301654 [Trichoderma atroviride IMI 206040]EHK40927.1 hypothetical protein TRIATDRAFT_301654 [Trichoderma atroviride IMI 206040]